MNKSDNLSVDVNADKDLEIKALRLLLEWAIQCNFGYDNFPEEYERYKDEIKDMGYKEGMIYIAKKEVKHNKWLDNEVEV